MLSRPARPKKRPANIRGAILNAARRLYFAHGIEGITARKIAQAVGCSPTAIYLYYENIGDLVEHLRIEGHALLADYLRAVDARLPPVERVRAMGRAYYRFGLENRHYYALMFGLRPTETPRREAIQREMHTLMLLRDVVQAGLETGDIRSGRDAMVLTNALWAQIHGVTALAVSRLLFETAPQQHEAVLETVLDTAVRSLRGDEQC